MKEATRLFYLLIRESDKVVHICSTLKTRLPANTNINKAFCKRFENFIKHEIVETKKHVNKLKFN